MMHAKAVLLIEQLSWGEVEMGENIPDVLFIYQYLRKY